jgi:hypothetical protein
LLRLPEVVFISDLVRKIVGREIIPLNTKISKPKAIAPLNPKESKERGNGDVFSKNFFKTTAPKA